MGCYAMAGPFKPSQIAQLLGVSISTVRRAADSHPLPDYRPSKGSPRLFSAADVAELRRLIQPPAVIGDLADLPAPQPAPLLPSSFDVDQFAQTLARVQREEAAPQLLAIRDQLQRQREEAAQFRARVLLAIWFAVVAVGIASIAVLISALTR